MNSRTPRPIIVVALVLLLAGLAASCASSRRAGSGGGFEPPERIPGDAIVVVVRNRNFDDALLVARSRSGERRLGYVNGKNEETFVLDASWSRDLTIRIRMVNTRQTCTTRNLVVEPGHGVQLIIEEPFTRSPACI